ncbi:MAG: hypothetical protein GWP91_03940, partial [Rhodobacterales bacterium]|nr:hypothetical protein [Rhodobacterales bacterium]
ITANAVLAWKNDNSDGTVFDLDGTANLDHMTVLGTGSQTLVNLTAGVSNVTQSAFAGEGTAVSTTASASVFGAYNLFDGVTIAGGTALEASLASTAGVLAPPDFRAWTPDSPSCDVDVLAPNPSSPLIADCAPEDASIHPDAEEIPYDGIDQDCNGDDLVDVDQDGVPGFQAGGEDCDDNDPTVSPFVDEDLSAIDRDCDGHTDPTDPLRPATCSQSARGPATPGTFILLLCGLLFLRGKQPLREPRRRPLFLPL